MKADAPKVRSARQRRISQDWKDYARIKRDHGPLTAFLFAEAAGLAGETGTDKRQSNEQNLP